MHTVNFYGKIILWYKSIKKNKQTIEKGGYVPSYFHDPALCSSDSV